MIWRAVLGGSLRFDSHDPLQSFNKSENATIEPGRLDCYVIPSSDADKVRSAVTQTRSAPHDIRTPCRVRSDRLQLRRPVYFGQEGQTVTGRTMDWFVSDMDTNMWLYPRGLERTSNTKTPVIWKSKYGSVVTTIYEGAAADGMNEKGLVANMLYLAESKYPVATAGDNRPTLSIAAWAQYVLDNYATTAEAVEGLRKEEFRIVPIVAPTGEPGTVHLSISDASGDSAIFEYLDGKLVIHHGKQYQVMTNSPTYDQQLGLAKYWESIGGATMLPGTKRADRPSAADQRRRARAAGGVGGHGDAAGSLLRRRREVLAEPSGSVRPAGRGDSQREANCPGDCACGSMISPAAARSHVNHTRDHRRQQVIDSTGRAAWLTWVRFPSPAPSLRVSSLASSDHGQLSSFFASSSDGTLPLAFTTPSTTSAGVNITPKSA